MLHLVLVDATPCMNTCLVFVKSIKPSAAVRTAPRPVFFRPPFGTCQSMLTQRERSKEPVPVCHRVSLFSPATCWPVGPMSLEWPLAQPGGPVQHGPALSHEDANSDRLGNARLGPPHQCWRRDAFQPPAVPRDQPSRDTCVHIPTEGLRCVSWSTRGLLGSTASSQRSREPKHVYLTRLTKKDDIICLQETHGEDEFLQAVQVLQTEFELFGIFMPKIW